jgi:hypothetical protein
MVAMRLFINMDVWQDIFYYKSDMDLSHFDGK